MEVVLFSRAGIRSLLTSDPDGRLLSHLGSFFLVIPHNHTLSGLVTRWIEAQGGI